MSNKFKNSPATTTISTNATTTVSPSYSMIWEENSWADGTITDGTVINSNLPNVTLSVPWTSYISDSKITIRSSDIGYKDGVSLEEALSKIEERLLILTPNPKLLEKYEALKKAYEHYKFLEKLLVEADKKSK